MDLIKEKRVEKNLSQDEFSEMLNISLKTYQSYEQGSRKPSLEVLVLMLIALDIPSLKINTLKKS